MPPRDISSYVGKLEGQAATGVSSCPKTQDPDNNDWQLHRRIFLQLASSMGPFDLDACSDDLGRNAHCSRFCSPSNSFFQEEIEGKRIYMNPPYDNIAKFLEHFYVVKERAPATSGVFVLPEWTSAPWFAEVQRRM